MLFNGYNSERLKIWVDPLKRSEKISHKQTTRLVVVCRFEMVYEVLG